jgi:hypothetical protein
MPATLTLSGKKFVVLSEDEYRSLKKQAKTGAGKGRSSKPSSNDAGDVAESRRRLKDPRRVSADAVFKKLGV